MLRQYEIVYIFHPALDDDGVTSRLERLHGLVTGTPGSEITAVDDWGLRQMAYSIADQSQGHYIVAQFTAAPDSLREFERLLKLEEAILRYLLVLSEGEPTSGMSILAEVPESAGRDDDDDDDDDDEDEDDEDEFAQTEGSPPEFSGGRGKRRRVDGPRIELLNYKDVSTLSRFITEQGKLLPKRTTKVTARFQRDLGTAIKRARFLSLLPYVQNHEK